MITESIYNYRYQDIEVTVYRSNGALHFITLFDGEPLTLYQLQINDLLDDNVIDSFTKRELQVLLGLK